MRIFGGPPNLLLGSWSTSNRSINRGKFSHWTTGPFCAPLYIFILFLASILHLSYEKVAAQQRQTVRLSVPIQQDIGPEAFDDSLLATLERIPGSEDSLLVSRHPEGKEMGISELRNWLINSAGIGVGSSSHVFIRYRFELFPDSFEERIKSLHYVYSPGYRQEDIDMLYLTTDKKWIRNLLSSRSGLSSNEAIMRPFRQTFSFLWLLENTDAEIQRIGGESATKEKKEKLVSRIRAAAGLSQ